MRAVRVRFVVLALIVASTAGCASSLPRIHETFGQNPQNYRRLEVAPVLFIGLGTLDHSMPAQALDRLRKATSAELASALKISLIGKGFTPSRAVQVLAVEKDVADMPPDVQRVVYEVHEEFGRITQAILQNLPRESTKPFRYSFGTRINELGDKLGIVGADAILMVQSVAFLTSPDVVDANARAALMAKVRGDFVYQYIPNRIEHRIALVDARTREILWFNTQMFNDRDARNPADLASTLEETLVRLSAVTSSEKSGH